MNRFIVAAAAVAGLAIAGSASASVNLITNGSFEDAGTTGHAAITAPWSYTSSFGSDTTHAATIIEYNSNAPYPDSAFGEAIPPAPTVAANPSPDAPGSYAAYFVADDATETLSQTIHLGVGTYTIGFSAYVPLNGFNNSGDATFTGTVAGQELVKFDAHNNGAVGNTYVPAKTWQNWTGTLVVTHPENVLTQFVYKSGAAPAADVVIDDVFVTRAGGIPEPATWGLMIMGFGGAGVMLRRRKTAALIA